MKKTALVIMTLCIAASAFAQGLYWQSTTEGSVGEGVTENFAMPKMFKTVSTGDLNNDGITIARLDKQLFWMLNPKKKTYSEMTFAQMEETMKKAGGKMDAAMEKMNKEMAGMPKEQREMMERMMGGKMPGTQSDAAVEMQKTADRKTIAGYACTKYVALQDGKEFMTMWVTKDVQGFESLMADWKEFTKRMSAMTSRFAKGAADAYKNIDGFPMQTTVSMMNNSVTTTVTKIERRTTPAREFDIPSGYTKVKSEFEGAMQEMDEEE